MVFDPNNPFAIQDPFSVFGRQQTAATQQTMPPLTHEEEKSLMDKIGAAGLGGLSFIGGILNKPGRVVRGLLGGTPREALNVIPFSDALGITRPEDEVRGQDLLGAKDAPFFSPEGIAGFGLDVATDPLTYLSFGGHALSKLGQAAKRASVLPETVAGRVAGVAGSDAYRLAKAANPAEYAANPIFAAADVAGQKLGGHIGVGLPGGGNAATMDLGPLGRALGQGVSTAASFVPGGSAALDIAGRGLGAAKGLYNRTIPPLFEAAVMGRQTPNVQEAARGITGAIPGVEAGAREMGMGLAKRAVENSLADEAGGKLIRHLQELPHVDPFTAAREIGNFSPEQVNAAKQIADEMSGTYQDFLKRRVAGGREAPLLTPQELRSGAGEGTQLGYAYRQKTELEPPTFRDYMRTKSPSLEGDEFRKGWTEGLTTHSLNTMAKEDLSLGKNANLWNDPAKMDAFSKLNPTEQVKQVILDKYLGGQKLETEMTQLQKAISADEAAHNMVVTQPELGEQLLAKQAEYAAVKRQAAALADMKVNNSLPQFLNHPIKDFVKKVTMEEINFLKQDGMYTALAKSAVAPGEGTMPIMEGLGKAWNPTETAGESITDQAGKLVGHEAPQGAQVQMAKALGTTVDKLSEFHVPQEVVNDLNGLSRARSYAGINDLVKIFDSVTNLTKAGQTMFPATVVRNASQDMFNKVVYGMFDPAFSKLDPRRYTQPMAEWYKIANGGTVDGLAEKLAKAGANGFAGLNDVQAADKLRQIHAAWDVSRSGAKRTAVGAEEIIGTAKAQTGLESLMPTSEQANPLYAYGKGFKEGSFAPSAIPKVAGVAGQTEDVFAPVKAARSASSASDSLMRGSSWYSKLLQGHSEESAFKEMMKAHYDFSNMSGFEKGVMRRVLPFYNWARQNVPAVTKEIAELPGGALANAVKATVAMKGEHPGFIPGYIGEGVAAPIGEEQDGKQRFLTHLGLGFEDLGQLAGPGGPLGMLNPLIKAPIEQATGKQLFTGRDIRDLHSRLGDLTGAPLPAVENALLNSPAGRVISTAGTLADPRKTALDKAVNLMTGARLSDVDVASARKSAILDYIREALRGPGISRFEDIAVRRDQIPQLSPMEQQLFRLYRTQQGR
jgi:hypothetical protein